jgi:hypothetical protein
MQSVLVGKHGGRSVSISFISRSCSVLNQGARPSRAPQGRSCEPCPQSETVTNLTFQGRSWSKDFAQLSCINYNISWYPMTDRLFGLKLHSIKTNHNPRILKSRVLVRAAILSCPVRPPPAADSDPSRRAIPRVVDNALLPIPRCNCQGQPVPSS